MTAGSDGERIVVGRIGKPFGIAGEVYVHADADLEEPLRAGMRCGTDRGEELVVARAHQHGMRLVVAFEGVANRDGAEALRGTVLTVPRDEIALAEGAIWVDELLGREVVDHGGDVVGTVEAVLDGPAHDFLSVARPNGGDLLVPLVPELVDIEADPIRLADLPGLLELGDT